MLPHCSKLVSVSYNANTGVSFGSQLTPSIMQSQEETPLLDEDEECGEESNPKSNIKVRSVFVHAEYCRQVEAYRMCM